MTSGAALPAPDPAADRAAWRALVARALRTDDADAALARLRSTTPDGITIEPLYTAPDGGVERQLAPPGFGTRRRGRTAVATRPDGWEIRQRVALDDCPARALEELERGTTSLWLTRRDGDDGAADGLDVDVLDTALDGVLLDLVPVAFDVGGASADAGRALVELWQRRGIAVDDRVARIGADPFGRWAGDPDVDLDGEFCAAVQLAEALRQQAPRASTFAIDGTRYHGAGATDVDELAFTIAAAVATLRGLEPRLGLPAAAEQIELRLAATADQFATIAKLRAARVMWARVLDACSIPGATVAPLHAVMSEAMMTAYDPAVNMLRATVAVFAAGVAGADAITVHPFDQLSGAEPTELGRRLARNTQAVLALESQIATVIDPAGGSWYVEQLTDAVATAAWHRFRQLEAAGGFRAAVDSGALDLIAESATRRDVEVAHRRTPVTGVSEFPDPNETPSATAAPAPRAGSPRLPVRRIADPVERQRRRTDALAAAAGARPRILLATIGTPADFTARVTFARNYFAAAGIDAAGGPVTADPETIADAYREHRRSGGSAVVCVCSNDTRYGEVGGEVVAALRAVDDAPRLYLAGRPGNLDELVAGGVSASIALGDDVVATLATLLDHLGAPPAADAGENGDAA